MKNRLHFGVSSVFHSLKKAFDCCSEAIDAVQLSTVLQRRPVLFHGDDSHKNRGISGGAELEKELVNVLFSGSTGELEEVLEKMLERFRDTGSSLADINQEFEELKVVIQRRLWANGVGISK